jgi:hypothetical protein
MIYTSENNWYSWSYGDLGPFSRQIDDSGQLPFKTQFQPYDGPIGTFRDELLKAARSTVDHSTGKLVILFSGGVDSEIMLRAFLEIGANVEVVIMRYENDYNIYDVSYAVTICSMLNIEYKILDFNLQKFYENDAMRISDLAQIDRPRALPYCKFLEMVDGYPLMANGDLTLYRIGEDYSMPGRWMIRCWEHDIGWCKFLHAIDKPGIAEWFKWTPGLVVSYMNTIWFSKLINDKYYGKLGANSTKIIGYREVYPDLIERKKQTGFEKIDSLTNEFESFLQKKYNALPYRQVVDRTPEQLRLEILGN